MFWKKISDTVQLIGKACLATGIFGTGLAYSFGDRYPMDAIKVMVIGLFIWFIGLCWTTYLDTLWEKREQKRIRRTAKERRR